MRLFMKSVLLLVAVIALCLCAARRPRRPPREVQPRSSKVPSSPAAAQATLSTVASLPADTTATPISKASKTQVPPLHGVAGESGRRPCVPGDHHGHGDAVGGGDHAASRRRRRRPGSNLPVPVPTVSAGSATLTPWPNATTYRFHLPDRIPDAGHQSGDDSLLRPDPLETVEPTPTWEGLRALSQADRRRTRRWRCRTSATGRRSSRRRSSSRRARTSVEPSPSPTGTVAPFPSAAPPGRRGLVVPAALGGLFLFILLGIAGVALLALGGSHLGTRPAGEPVVAPAPAPRAEVRLLQPGAPEPTMEQQVLIDRIAGFAPQSMHVERLGKNLLRFQRGAQVDAQDRSLRLGPLLVLSAIPSAPAPAPASAWARAHGFRILAVDGSGMALVMAALSNGGRSVLGVLPVGSGRGREPRPPMPVLPEDGRRGGRTHPASFTGVGAL